MIITEQKRKRINIYFKAFILLVILVGIPLYFYFFQRDFITQFTSVSDIENYRKELEIDFRFQVCNLSCL